MPADLEGGPAPVTFSVIKPPEASVEFDLEVNNAPALYVDDPKLWPPRSFVPDRVRLVISANGNTVATVFGGRRLFDGSISRTTRDTRRFSSYGATMPPEWLIEVIRPCRQMAHEMMPDWSDLS